MVVKPSWTATSTPNEFWLKQKNPASFVGRRVFLCLAQTQTMIKIILFNLVAIALVLTSVELFFLNLNSTKTIEKSSLGGPYLEHTDVLGTVPRANQIITAKKFTSHNELIFDVQYSIDKDLTRKTPNSLKNNGWLFFGCSYTFGQGVNDDQVFPAVFQAMHHNHIKAFNFGFKGYGPHQMLRRLQTDFTLDKVAQFKIKKVIYLAIPDHIRRAAGGAPWDSKGPYYDFNDSEELIFKGPFQPDNFSPFFKWPSPFAAVDWFSEHLTSFILHLPKNKEHNTKRFIEILSATQKLVTQKYNAPLIVLLWWTEEEGVTQIESQLHNKGIATIRLNTHLPYIKGDTHPNWEAHKEIANVLMQIL